MMVGVLLILAGLGFFSYGCMQIIAYQLGIALPYPGFYANLVLMEAGPPLLLLTALYAYGRARRWRIMKRARNYHAYDHASALLRGYEASQHSHETGPSALEHLCLALIWLSIIAGAYWLDLPTPEYWLGMILIAIWIVRRALR